MKISDERNESSRTENNNHVYAFIIYCSFRSTPFLFRQFVYYHFFFLCRYEFALRWMSLALVNWDGWKHPFLSSQAEQLKTHPLTIKTNNMQPYDFVPEWDERRFFTHICKKKLLLLWLLLLLCLLRRFVLLSENMYYEWCVVVTSKLYYLISSCFFFSLFLSFLYSIFFSLLLRFFVAVFVVRHRCLFRYFVVVYRTFKRKTKSIII